jgi:hypothetical protein
LPEVHCIDLAPLLSQRVEGKPPVLSVVLASDGIWDNWLYEDVTAYVTKPEMIANAQQSFDIPSNEISGSNSAASSLINQNGIYARANFGNQADNATGIVLYITQQED